tara:strand:- start:19 stop:393 length:375 start_codon:yes stop_codon:yes gene_type:complete
MGKVAKKVKGEAKWSTYIAKIAKKYTHSVGDDKEDLTVSKTAITELELLADDAIRIITRNADKILTYSNTFTFGKAAAEGATKLAFSGLLRDQADEAGNMAVASYEAHELAAKQRKQAARVGGA